MNNAAQIEVLSVSLSAGAELVGGGRVMVLQELPLRVPLSAALESPRQGPVVAVGMDEQTVS